MSIFRSVTAQLFAVCAVALLAFSLNGCCCCGGGPSTINTPDDGTISVDADDVTITDTDAPGDDTGITDTDNSEDADGTTDAADDSTLSSDGDPVN